MKIIQKIGQGFIIIALSMLLLPDVFTVWFHSHEHTEDNVSELNGYGIENLHEHCLELDFYVSSVFNTGVNSFELVGIWVPKIDVFIFSELFSFPIQPSLRGPPRFLAFS